MVYDPNFVEHSVLNRRPEVEQRRPSPKGQKGGDKGGAARGGGGKETGPPPPASCAVETTEALPALGLEAADRRGR